VKRAPAGSGRAPVASGTGAEAPAAAGLRRGGSGVAWAMLELRRLCIRERAGEKTE
jgi:hypothetical protein